MKIFSSYVAVALAIALICRLTVAFIASQHPEVFVDPDSNDYIKLADHLARAEEYTKGEEPEIFRAPGYPFFLSLFQRFSSQYFLAVVIFQAFLSVGSIFLLWRLAKLLFDDKTAMFAVCFQCLSLSSVVFANKILSETLFTFFLMLTLFSLELSLKRLEDEFDSSDTFRFPWIPAILAGCAGAVALMTRAIFVPLVPAFAIYIAIRTLISALRLKKFFHANSTEAGEDASKSSHLIKNSLTRFLLLLLLFLLPILTAYGAWSLRNWKTADFAGFSSVGRINIYRYYACLLLAKNNGRSFDEQQAICTAEIEARGSQAKQAAFSVRKGLPIILKEPVRYFFLHLKTDISSLLPDVGDLYRLLGFNIGGSGTLAVIRSHGILAGVKHYFDGKWGLFFAALPLIMVLGARFAAAALGTLAAFKSSNRMTLLFFAVIIVYMLVVPGAVSHPRFRVPVEPLISLLAAFGASWGLSVLKNEKERVSRKAEKEF